MSRAVREGTVREGKLSDTSVYDEEAAKCGARDLRSCGVQVGRAKLPSIIGGEKSAAEVWVIRLSRGARHSAHSRAYATRSEDASLPGKDTTYSNANRG